MATPLRGSGRLASPLYVICDHEACAGAGWPIVEFAAACIDGGARLLQLRVKNASGRKLLDIALEVTERARRAGAQVIVNDRADIALLSGAAGVHVGQEDLLPNDVRHVVGRAAIVGLSTHTPEQVQAALGQQLSYVATGPVFGTATKDTGYGAVGLGAVRSAAAAVHRAGMDLVAIGGMTLDRAAAAIDAGADAVAVISDLLATGDPAARVHQFLTVLPQADRKPPPFRHSGQEPQ